MFSEELHEAAYMTVDLYSGGTVLNSLHVCSFVSLYRTQVCMCTLTASVASYTASVPPEHKSACSYTASVPPAHKSACN